MQSNAPVALLGLMQYGTMLVEFISIRRSKSSMIAVVECNSIQTMLTEPTSSQSHSIRYDAYRCKLCIMSHHVRLHKDDYDGDDLGFRAHKT